MLAWKNVRVLERDPVLYPSSYAELYNSLKLPRKALSLPRLACLLAVGILLVTFHTIRYQAFEVYIDFSPSKKWDGNDDTQNATLGFQKILALSARPGWRTRSLAAAANLTDLAIEVINQPRLAPAFVTAFQQIGPLDAVHPASGSATAWLAHLDILKYIIMSQYESVLILEDDVDWDIAIKDQMRRYANAVRSFTAAASLDRSPYGSSWDVLWMGHCGEAGDIGQRYHVYNDPSRVTNQQYHSFNDVFEAWKDVISDTNRSLSRSKNTVCSFAYAVHRGSAQRVLEWTSQGQNEAFDISLMAGCKSESLNCIVVVPELMHHYEPPKQAGYVSAVSEGDGKGRSADDKVFEGLKGHTSNIRDSARCRALFNETCQV